MKNLFLLTVSLVFIACGKHNDSLPTQSSTPVDISQPEAVITYTCGFRESFTTQSYNSWSHHYYTVTTNTFDCVSSKAEVCVTETKNGSQGFSTNCEHADLLDASTLVVP